MPRRNIEVNGQQWEVAPSGRVTQYNRDEFGLIFTRGSGPERVQRIVRYSPLMSRSSELAFEELSDQQLHDLLERSQPSWTAPETEYRR
ncbi:MAG: hypothetical protein ABJD11_12765 [Gemmatimonadota bacterium]